ncbi:MAG: biopolymer transporter ExbD [Pseudomonadota bacterium]
MAYALPTRFPANRPRRRRLTISLTPLIDVVFILLVFFMLASSFLDWRSIRLESGQAGGATPGVVGALMVTISPDGLRLSGLGVTRDQLAGRLAPSLAEDPGRRIAIRPTGGVDMQRLVKLLDDLAVLGATNVVLMPGAR